jgi:hypothetical protein
MEAFEGSILRRALSRGLVFGLALAAAFVTIVPAVLMHQDERLPDYWYLGFPFVGFVNGFCLALATLVDRFAGGKRNPIVLGAIAFLLAFMGASVAVLQIIYTVKLAATHSPEAAFQEVARFRGHLMERPTVLHLPLLAAIPFAVLTAVRASLHDRPVVETGVVIAVSALLAIPSLIALELDHAPAGFILLVLVVIAALAPIAWRAADALERVAMAWLARESRD